MKERLYLSMIPESLIVSMLSPEEFGNYYAVGSRKRSRGQAVFFEVDPDRMGEADLPWGEVEERFVQHPDGTPKRSVYLSIYRALEKVPLAALGALYLVTDDGRVLALHQQEYDLEQEQRLHFYQELCPLTPRVVSVLPPDAFSSFITGESSTLKVPKIVFCNLMLRALRHDPEAEDIGDLPYGNIGHLRDCLRELSAGEGKPTKTVDRQSGGDLPYRTIKDGFFVGEGSNVLYYPMPSRTKLERECYEWWRSAQSPVLL
ncbi:MAG: hypothetical protein ACLFUF_05735 [Opitutales bacterium]